MTPRDGFFASECLLFGLLSIVFIMIGQNAPFIAAAVVSALLASGCFSQFFRQYLKEKNQLKEEKELRHQAMQKQLTAIQTDNQKQNEEALQQIQANAQLMQETMKTQMERQLKGLQNVVEKLQQLPELQKQHLSELDQNMMQQLTKQKDILQKQVNRQLAEQQEVDERQTAAFQEVINEIKTMPALMKETVENIDKVWQKQMDKQLASLQTITHNIDQITIKVEKNIKEGVKETNQTFAQTNKILQTIPVEIKQSQASAHDELEKQMTEYMNVLRQAQEDFADTLKKLNRSLGDNIEDMNDSFSDTRDSVADAAEAIKTNEDTIASQITELAKQYKDFQNFANALIKELTDLSKADQKYWKEFLK